MGNLGRKEFFFFSFLALLEKSFDKLARINVFFLNKQYFKMLHLENAKFLFYTTKKLVNINRNTDRQILLIYCDNLYR